MAAPLRTTFARLCRGTRLGLDVTQAQLADAVGVSRAHIASIESGRCNPSLALVQRISDALGLELEFVADPPVVVGREGHRDTIHARCSGYVDRRLRAAGWETRREIEVVHGRMHGWIDLLAWDPRTRTLLIVELKTRLDDLGRIERQVGWYERMASGAGARAGWRPVRTQTWLLALASDEVEAVIRTQRDLLRAAFPLRARDLLAVSRGAVVASSAHRGLALIDPASRRRDWLIPSRSDGRRSVAPYRGYADAVHRLG